MTETLNYSITIHGAKNRSSKWLFFKLFIFSPCKLTILMMKKSTAALYEGLWKNLWKCWQDFEGVKIFFLIMEQVNRKDKWLIFLCMYLIKAFGWEKIWICILLVFKMSFELITYTQVGIQPLLLYLRILYFIKFI